MISKDIIGMNCKQFINFLKKQPACVVEDLLNKVRLPKQMDTIIRLRCIEYNSFIEVCDKMNMTREQQILRIKKAKNKINIYLLQQ